MQRETQGRIASKPKSKQTRDAGMLAFPVRKYRTERPQAADVTPPHRDDRERSLPS